jgi:rhamnosyltransferase
LAKSTEFSDNEPLTTVNVVAVVSTFNPDETVVARLRELANVVAHVVVVDDSGTSTSSGDSIWLGTEFPDNVRLLRNDINRGIAASLNRGISAALEYSAAYVMTLDQDTPIPGSLVSELLHALQQRRAQDENFVGAAPGRVNGSMYSCVHERAGGQCSVEVIQSGLLLHRTAFELVGLFNEDLFIDGVEVEYLMRLHQLDRHVLLVETLDLEQPLGSPLTIRAWGRNFRTSNHPPFRRYYITRNRLVLLKRFWRTDPQWAKVSGTRLIRHSFRAALIEPQRLAKARAMTRGAVHAIRGRLGKDA